MLQQENTPAGCSKRPSSKAAASEGPEAYPQGYVEGLNDARTPLAGFFSSLLEQLVEGKRNRSKSQHKHGKGDPSDNDPLSAQRHVKIAHRRMPETP